MIERLPERIDGPGGVMLRRWAVADAEVLAVAVAESLEHLRPWMDWTAQEPMTIERRRKLIAGWEREWSDGGDVTLGLFHGDQVVGGSGLHRRLGPDGLEIGYWVHPAFVRRGLATTASGLLTGAALSLPGITHVEIHHDKANLASAGVPRKLVFRLVDEGPRQPTAPADVGIECRWRMDRDEWARRAEAGPAT
jgi:ribosomal-protein-serine acetyltransferase